jgi:aspartate aminotransferase-like enzyme
MRYEHNIEFASSSGTLAHRFFRIGNFGNINEHDIDYMLKALEETLTSMGVLL